MAHEVFISHSSLDKPVADAVCAALEETTIRCWLAPRDVQPGRSFAGEITRAIQHSKVMVLIFSAHSNTSEQILREVQLAANSHLHIVQFRIENVLPNEDLEYYLSAPHWLDALTPPLENNIRRLRSSVKALLEMTCEEGAKRAVTPLASSMHSRAERNHQSGVATDEGDGVPVKSSQTMQSQPAIPPVASISAIAGPKEPSVWRRKPLIMVTGGVAAALLLLTVTVLLTRPHPSIDSSAEKDYAEAMKLENGTGVPKDVGKAIQLYQKAADHGYARAQAKLGFLYWNGRGVLKDETKAFELFQKAADQGYAPAQTRLGDFYQYGIGVPKDLGKATEFYKKAADQGDVQAQTYLDHLSLLTPAPYTSNTPYSPSASASSGGSLWISTKPVGATVIVDGSITKISPATFSNLPSGQHHLQVILEGYQTEEKEVEIQSGLVKAPGTITLLANSQNVPPSSSASTLPQPKTDQFDGVWIGRDPSGSGWSSVLTISGGTTASMTMTLTQKRPPKYDRWSGIPSPYDKSRTLFFEWSAESTSVRVTTTTVGINWTEWKLKWKPSGIPYSVLQNVYGRPGPGSFNQAYAPIQDLGLTLSGSDLTSGAWTYHRKR